MHRIMCSIEAELGKMVPDAFGCDMLSIILPTEAMSFTQSGSKGKATEGGPEAATNVLSGNTRPVRQQLSVNGAERPSSNLTSAPQTTSKAKGKDPIRDSSSSTSNLSPEDLRPSKKRKVSRSTEVPAREALSAQKHPEMASSKTTSGEPLASKKHEYSQNGDETSSKKSKKRRHEASVISGQSDETQASEVGRKSRDRRDKRRHEKRRSSASAFSSKLSSNRDSQESQC